MRTLTSSALTSCLAAAALLIAQAASANVYTVSWNLGPVGQIFNLANSQNTFNQFQIGEEVKLTLSFTDDEVEPTRFGGIDMFSTSYSMSLLGLDSGTTLRTQLGLELYSAPLSGAFSLEAGRDGFTFESSYDFRWPKDFVFDVSAYRTPRDVFALLEPNLQNGLLGRTGTGIVPDNTAVLAFYNSGSLVDVMNVGPWEEATQTFDTAAIPLPAAGWLLFGGLGALALKRRARHA